MTDDPLDQFARAHLRSPVERSVYFVLAATPEETWTAPEVAHETGHDELDVDQTLRRFAADGIIERQPSPGRRPAYRLRHEMRYLFGDRHPDERLVDPVCGMPVDPSTPHVTEVDGVVVRFCSRRCQALYARRDRRTARESPEPGR